MSDRFLKFFRVVCLIGLLSISVSAQTQQNSVPSIKEAEINRLIDRAEEKYQAGASALAANNLGQMREKFDMAVDEILNSGIDIHSDYKLQAYYRELVDRIVHLQLSLKSENGISNQKFEGNAVNDIGRLSDTDLENLTASAPAHKQPKLSGFSFQAKGVKDGELPHSVNQFINYFVYGKGRKTLETGFARSGRYRKLAEDTFDKFGVPRELIWLAQVESVWQPGAASPAAARGIWQFIPGTGAQFGLRQNNLVDERLDPEKSTEAAARYLSSLSDRYAGDWLLAMAAYNMGENGLDRAIEKCGYADFWVLREKGYIPQETRNYVPAILAVIAIANQPDAYGVDVTTEAEWQFDRATIEGASSLQNIATSLKVPFNTLAALNPELVSYQTPGNNYQLRVPKGASLAEIQPRYKTRNVVKKRVGK